MGAEQVDLAAIAILRRALDRGADRAGVLEDAGLTEPVWLALEEEVLASLSDDLDRGDTSRIERYRKAYEGSGEDEAPVTEPGPRTEVTPPLVVEPSSATPFTPKEQAATFQRVAPPPPPAASPAVAPPPEPPPRARTPAFDPDQTAEVDKRQAFALRSAIPFTPASAPKPPPSIPIERTAVPVSAPQPVAPQPPAPQPAGRKGPKTLAIDASSLQGPALPFTGKAHAPAPSAQRTARPTPAIADEATRDEPGGVPRDADGLPFTQPPGTIPLERFAAIQAAITKGEPPQQVLARHGLTSAAWAAVFNTMRGRLQADAALRARYEQLFREALL